MTPLLLALLISGPMCERHSVTGVAFDADGAPVPYKATYWLCTGNARPAAWPVMKVCFESGNPYGRTLWSHPASKQDLLWLCTPY